MRSYASIYKRTETKSIEKNVIILLILMALGSLAGGIFMCYSKIVDYQNIENIIQTKDLEIVNYIEIIFKNAKYLITIWILGFVSIGGYFIYLLTFIKGFSFGFATSMIFYILQMEGIKYATFTYIPQSFLYIPFYIFVCVKAMQNIKCNKKSLNNKINNYKILFLIIIFSIIISILDLVFIGIF